MRVRTIKYSRRKNLGNYEGVEIAVEAELDVDEDPDVEMDKIKKFVRRLLKKEKTNE